MLDMGGLAFALAVIFGDSEPEREGGIRCSVLLLLCCTRQIPARGYGSHIASAGLLSKGNTTLQ